MTVRTKVLASGLSGGAGAVTTVYTCPPGRTAILKDIRVQGVAVASTECVVGVTSGAGLIRVLNANLSAPQVAALSPCFIALAPGHTIWVFNTVFQGMSFSMSGAELDGVAP